MKLIWEGSNISLSLSTAHLGEFLRSLPNVIYTTIIYKQEAILKNSASFPDW